MSVIPARILEKAREDCQEIIDKLKTMPMCSIVNVIEQILPCQIIIQPITTSEISSTCLAICPISLIAGNRRGTKKIIKKDFRHYFIHYARSDDKELERFRVAHECGHCYSWPPLEGNRKVYPALIPEVGLELYMVRFELVDEMYADAFASIMVNYSFSPTGVYPDVVISKKLLGKIEEYARKGYLRSTFFKK